MTKVTSAGIHFSHTSPILANPMAACGSLQVILRIEVAIHKNNSVSSCKVHSNSPCKDMLQHHV